MGNIVSPGLTILKSWQGIVEIILRVACIVLSFILLICASVVTGAINNIEDLEDEDDVSDYDSGAYRSAAGWLIFVAVMGMIIQTGVIIIRFLNIGFINQNFIIFGFIDVANSVVFVLSLFAGGTANAAYSADNADIHDDRCNMNDDQQEACDNLETVRNAEGATAAFAYFAMVAYGILAGIILFVLLTQYINKPRSSDPSSNYQESSGPNNQEPTS